RPPHRRRGAGGGAAPSRSDQGLSRRGGAPCRCLSWTASSSPTARSRRCADRALARLGPESIVRLGIAHVPEGRRVFPGLTVRENIVLGASNRRRAPKAEVAADLERMFATFPELRPFADALGWTLSGGQQQMVAIARGLMSRPRLLM